MGRIVVTSFVSIDGVIQSPLSPEEDQDGGLRAWWLGPASATRPATPSCRRRPRVRPGCSWVAARTTSWPQSWSQADESEPAVAAMNQMPKYVITSSPIDLAWANSHVIGVDISTAVRDVRHRTRGDLAVFGAGTLARGLAEHQLVDMYRLLIFPVVLGAGKRMFDERGHLAHFELSTASSHPAAWSCCPTCGLRVRQCVCGDGAGTVVDGVEPLSTTS